MKRRETTRVIALLFVALVALGAGCSPESKARRTLENFETPFGICKEETERRTMAPCAHRCALVSSIALDAGLKDSGLDDARIEQMRDEWLEKSGYEPFYIPAEKRTLPAPDKR